MSADDKQPLITTLGRNKMTAQQKKQVGDLKALLEKMPKEGSFDPALEFKLELLQLLLPFCLNNRKFSAFLTELRDVLL